jgi:hypothetical protein
LPPTHPVLDNGHRTNIGDGKTMEKGTNDERATQINDGKEGKTIKKSDK